MKRASYGSLQRRRILEAIESADRQLLACVQTHPSPPLPSPPLPSPLRAGGVGTQATICNSENRGRLEYSRGSDQ